MTATAPDGYAVATIQAHQLTVGDRFDRGLRNRVALVHEHNGQVVIRVTTRGTRSPTVRRYAPADTVTVYRPTPKG